MPSQEKFSLLRSVLKAIGLSSEAIDDITHRIVNFLTDKGDKSSGSFNIVVLSKP